MARGILGAIALTITGVGSYIALTTYTTLGNIGAGFATVVIMILALSVVRKVG